VLATQIGIRARSAIRVNYWFETGIVHSAPVNGAAAPPDCWP